MLSRCRPAGFATLLALVALALFPAGALASEEGVFAEPVVPSDTTTAAPSTPSPTGATITSDHADYRPGALVTLSGAGWVPGEAVQIVVEDDGISGLFWHHEVTVTADVDGYILDQFNIADWFVANYYVTATGDQSGQATHSFTDAAQADIEQCRNGTDLVPVQCTNAAWVNGNANATQAHFVEGESQAYRAQLEDLDAGTWTFRITYDTTQTGNHGIDYLTTFDRTETTADPCTALSFTITGACNAAVPNSFFPIPGDFRVTNGPDGAAGGGDDIAQVAGNIELFGAATITNVSVPALTNGTYTNGTGYIGSTQTSVDVFISVPANDTNLVVAWGGHISKRQEWAPEPTAADINGSAYHMRSGGLDAPGNPVNFTGGNQDLALSAGAVVSPASVTIVKEATPEGSTSFPFTSSLDGGFSLVDDGAGAGVGSTTFNFTTESQFVSRTYTETPIPSGWNLTGINCVEGGLTPDNGSSDTGATATADVDEGEDITCTFTNEQQAGITITKDTVPNALEDFDFDGAGSGIDADFDLDDDAGVQNADNTLSNTKTFTNPGTGDKYIQETAEPGYSIGSITCSTSDAVSDIVIGRGGTTTPPFVNGGGDGFDPGDDTVKIPLGAGEQVSCTFLNNKDASVKVIKDADPNDAQDFDFDGSGGGIAGDFDLDDDGDPTLQNSVEFTIDSADGFDDKSFKENTPNGWSIANIDCTGAGQGEFSSTADSATVGVDPGETIECTFVNNKDTTVTIIKDADPNDAQDFAFTTTGSGLSGFSLDDDADNALSNQRQFTISGRNFGTKTVTEGSVAGWALTNISCTGDSNAVEDEANRKATLDVDPGETIVCTFNNRKDASVTVTKQLEPSADDGRFDLKVDQDVVKANAADGESGSKGGLAPGTYTVSEVIGSASPAGRLLSDYVTGIECSGESAAQGAQSTVTVSAGEDATCTITNTRKGSIKVTKDLAPDTDDGRFDLLVGDEVVADEVGDGGNGTKTGLSPGTYTVSELMGSTTPGDRVLANYDSTVNCSGESGPQVGTSQQVTVSAGENVECTITNTRIRVPDAPVIDTTPQCLRRPLLAWVRSKPRNKPTLIKKVTFYLDGKVVGVDRRPDKQNRFTTLIERRELADGPHKLRAKIQFFGSKKIYWLGLKLKRCLNMAVPQEITTTAPSNGRCPTGEFLAYVKGSIISSVTYTLNGQRLRTLRVSDWKKRYAVKIDPSQLGSGKNVLEARIRFITGTKKGAITLTEDLPSCGSTLADKKR